MFIIRAVSIHSSIDFPMGKNAISFPFMSISSGEKCISSEVIPISSEEMRVFSEEKAFYSE